MGEDRGICGLGRTEFIPTIVSRTVDRIAFGTGSGLVGKWTECDFGATGHFIVLLSVGRCHDAGNVIFGAPLTTNTCSRQALDFAAATLHTLYDHE